MLGVSKESKKDEKMNVSLKYHCLVYYKEIRDTTLLLEYKFI